MCRSHPLLVLSVFAWNYSVDPPLMNPSDLNPGGRVNHRAVNMVGKSLDFAEVDQDYVFEGLGYTAHTCPEWISWEEWVQVMDRLAEQAGSDDALRRIGYQVFQAPSAVYLLRLVGFFGDLGSMLMRMNELIMQAFFKGLDFQTTIDKEKLRCEARITIPEELKACRSFLVMSSSAYEAIFQQLKVSYSDFQFTCTERTAVYSFSWKFSPNIFARLRRIYRVIIGADFAVKQIADNEDELRRRLEIVEAAREEAEILRKKEREARKIAEEALQVRQRFLAVMSHELRTPLNHIIGCASIMKSEMTDEDDHEYVDIIHRSSHSLLELIEQVLDFTSAGTLSAESPQTLSLPELLDPLIVKARHACELKALDFVFPSLEGEQPLVVVYVGHLKRILKLLLDNAIKFTSEGTVSLEVACNQKDLLWFTVKDTGIGIPDKWQHEIFEPFRAVDSSDTRSEGGIGLGLTIARKLAREIGGDLELEYSTHRGSSFRLTVPLDVKKEDKSKEKAS